MSSKLIDCPHCGQKVSVGFSLHLVPQMANDGDGEESNQNWMDGLPPNDKQIIEQAESNGSMAAFSAAWSENIGGLPTKNPGRNFLTWARIASYKSVPREVLDFFISEFPKTKIEFVGANDVMAVLSDGRLRVFLPFKLVSGRPIRNQGGKKVGVVDVDISGFYRWTKLRQGYCAGRGWFFGEMTTRARGDFVMPATKKWKTPSL